MSSAVNVAIQYGSVNTGTSEKPPEPRLPLGTAVPLSTTCNRSRLRENDPNVHVTDGNTKCVYDEGEATWEESSNVFPQKCASTESAVWVPLANAGSESGPTAISPEVASCSSSGSHRPSVNTRSAPVSTAGSVRV